MILRSTKQAILLFAFCVMALALLAAEQPKTVSLSELPSAVQKTIQTQLSDGKLGEIERVEEDGGVTYEVKMTKGGTDRGFSVAEDGTLLSVEVTLDETPVAVRKTIEKQVGQGTLEDIDKTFDDGETSYDVEMTTKDGADRSFTVVADGKLQRMQVTLAGC